MADFLVHQVLLPVGDAVADPLAVAVVCGQNPVSLSEFRMQVGVNRPGESGDSKPWEGWSS
ncbi:MAG: hypothetical protein ACOYEV_18290, partial [Candidatus Nanopelagicales bacterium]